MRWQVIIASGLGGLPAGAVCAQSDAAAPPREEGAAAAEGEPLVAYPHPLITEIFFSVPGSGGDANRDGQRSAAGDEFVELMNPHEQPINLIGYELSDRPTASQFRFRFPDLALAPGEVVVVFNGHDCSWHGPVGDAHSAPEAGNSLFEGAWVFTARAESGYTSLANTAEFVLLTAPGGEAVHAIEWGYPDDAPPQETGIMERIQAPRGRSVQRSAPGGPLREHPREAAAAAGVLTFDLPCSPGLALPGWAAQALGAPPASDEPPDSREGPAREPPPHS